MPGLCRPHKTLKAAQTIIIEISEPMFTRVTFLGSARTPHIQKRKLFFYTRVRVKMAGPPPHPPHPERFRLEKKHCEIVIVFLKKGYTKGIKRKG